MGDAAPLGGERETKDREISLFNQKDRLCRGLYEFTTDDLSILSSFGPDF